MADRVLFRWPGAAIMGDDRPRYVAVDSDFKGGSPVWGEHGVIAALLARAEAAEARLAEAEGRAENLDSLADMLLSFAEARCADDTWAANLYGSAVVAWATERMRRAGNCGYLRSRERAQQVVDAMVAAEAAAPPAAPPEPPAGTAPCPFCGSGETKLVGWPSWAESAVAWRACTSCGACGPPLQFEARNGEGGNPGDFDAAWNRRAAPPPIDPLVERVVEAARGWQDAAAAPAPEFDPCDACIIYGPDIDNPAKHPMEECPVTKGARLAWSEKRVAASVELHAAVAALRAARERKEDEGG